MAHERCLGAQLHFDKRGGNADVDERHRDAEKVFERIECVELPLEAKAELASAAAVPKLSFDACVSAVSARKLRNWRSRAARSIWGRGCPARCIEILFTLLCPGHLCDPLQNRVYRIILEAQRILDMNGELLPLFIDLLARRRRVPRRRHTPQGPARQFLWACQQLRWQVHLEDGRIVIERPGHDSRMDLLEPDHDLLAHYIREDLRLALWAQAAQRRPDEFDGLASPAGIDRTATLSLLNSLRGRERRLLQTILMGGVDTRERRFKRKLAWHSKCFFCCFFQPLPCGNGSTRAP